MRVCSRNRPFLGFLAFFGLCTILSGCQTYRGFEPPVGQTLPREGKKKALPPYVVEPPDVLDISALSLVPKGELRIQPLDTIIISVFPPFPGEPIDNKSFTVSAEGTVRLGGHYPTVLVAGKTPEEAEAELVQRLSKLLNKPEASITLAETRAVPEIDGQHLIGQDGTINVGGYGEIFVAGMTLPEVKAAVEKHLNQFDLDAKVAVAVSGFNSKFFYLIIEDGSGGYGISRVPVTGRETVLDIFAASGGVPSIASLYNIYIARPTEEGNCEQIIPVNIADIMKRASTCTNYQLLPGDRLYVKAQGVVTFASTVEKILRPIQDVSGAALLGITTYQSLINTSSFFGGTGFGGTPGFGFGGF